MSALLLALIMCAWSGAAFAQTVLAAFTVLAPDGAVGRTIIAGSACPTATIDGRVVAMHVRAQADARFPLVCDVPLPPGAGEARLGDVPVPVPRAEVGRVVVFGDSGCRVDARSREFQSCNNPAQWPFARTSAAGAALEPDLVIHVGDYLYRESSCPPNDAGCAGSPSGDNWSAWRADFFEPAAKLLRAAPWVMVRGNHENCNRAGEGFFRLLDPRPLPASCPRISPTYAVRAGTLTLFVLDSGEANDASAPAALVATYKDAFATMTGAPPGSWLLTHRPLWAVVRIRTAAGASVIVNDNATLEAASDNMLPPGVSLVVSGHIHLFEALGFADGRAPQFVFGTAGSSLSDSIDLDLAGHPIGGTTIAYGRTLQAFGVTTMERTKEGWAADLRGEDGAIRFTCMLSGAKVDCQP